MNILVCIKQVPDDSVEIHLNADGAPDLANVTPVVNAFDTYALEMAARLKESSEGEVTVVCVGEDSAKNSLKNCLAVGADHAFLVSDDAFKDSDTTGIANILKNVVAKLEADNGQKFDLIFTGKEATDAALGQGGLMLAEELGTSKNQIFRFIRLTNLIPELLDLVDEKKISFNPAVELSYLDEAQQRDFLQAMDETQNAPSLSQAQRMKKLAQEEKFTYEAAFAIMGEAKKDELDKVVIKNDTLKKYFPRSYTPRQMEDVIIKLLEQWQRRQQRQNER